ncbi:hypothetical protein ABN763_04745 [Spongiivirga sp. MCCC 1A20706]|uniref:hypothetical protein n=1 Tax=Spongiivirga sp. MCCC 1A20706 TaxID=3160963 RepID=UPI003977C8D4
MLVTIIDQTISGETKNQIKVDLNESVTAEDIIKARVTQEVENYNSRAANVFKGLVQPTNREQQLNDKKFKPIDVEKQVYVALDAFQKNGFFILVNDHQLSEIDEKVTINENTEISFVKLTPLVGG